MSEVYIQEELTSFTNEVMSRYLTSSLISMAELYSKSPRVFIYLFLNCNSFRMLCAFIRKETQRSGLYQECKATGKDFSEWANKQNLEEKWKSVLADTLLIINNVIN